MIKEMMIDNKRKKVFLLEEGESAYIVIPFESLIHVDYKRLKPLSDKAAKNGESLMRLMSDAMLDNGKNCLSMYKDMIKVVYKAKAPVVVLESGTTERPTATVQQSSAKRAPTLSSGTTKAKRRGRPPKASVKTPVEAEAVVAK